MSEICLFRVHSTCLDVRSVPESLRDELNLWRRALERGCTTGDWNGSNNSPTPPEWHTWNINGFSVRAPQWTLHCLEVGNLKKLYVYHGIRDNYWADVIAGSKRDLKNILVLLMFLPYTVFGYGFNVLVEHKRLTLLDSLG